MEKLKEIIDSIVLPDEKYLKKALLRLSQQARPKGSLGVLEGLSARLSGIFNTLDVFLDKKVIVTCAGDHGVVAEGISVFPGEVTSQMVHNFVNRGASINVLAKHAGAEVRVADLGVNYDFDPYLPIFHKKIGKGTNNFVVEPAMSKKQAINSILSGIDIVDELLNKGGVDIIGTGDMGIGNTTPSTAIIAAVSGISVDKLTGRGTGIDDKTLLKKIAVINKGLALHKPDPNDPIDILSKVGGFEIGGIAGLVIGSAQKGIPVVCDGLISTAGALLACMLAPYARAYLFASHNSVEAGHVFMLKHLGLNPLVDLGFRLGEGTGAAVAFTLLEASTRVLAEIKTFEEVKIGNAHL